MMSEDSEDDVDMGVIGKVRGRLEKETIFWRIVVTLRMQPSDVDGWSLGEMRAAISFVNMQNDYKRAWSAMYDIRREKENGG